MGTRTDGILKIYFRMRRKWGEKMEIGDKEIKELYVTTEKNELIVSITDENVIEKEGYKVVRVPVSD